jgi:hypothetical protein
MPCEHGQSAYDVDAERQPLPQHPICERQAKTLTIRSIDYGELVSRDFGLQV